VQKGPQGLWPGELIIILGPICLSICHLPAFHISIGYSEITLPIGIKLNRKDVLKVIYKNSSFRYDPTKIYIQIGNIFVSECNFLSTCTGRITYP
jgi:hypothetical protein